MLDGAFENYVITILSITALTFAIIWVYIYAQKMKMENIRTKALQKSLEKYKKFFHTANEGIVQCDLDGTITLINDAGARLLGFKDASTLHEQDPKSTKFYLDLKHREQNIEDMNSTGKVDSRVLTFKQHDGKKVDVEFTAQHLKDENGNVIGYEAIFRDVTKRLELEKKLVHYSETLEDRVKAKTREVVALERNRIKLENLAALGEMAAMIVHEIKNPLASIKMGVSTILKRTGLEDRDKKCLQLAGNEVERLERFLKAVLDFSKPMKLQFVKQDVNVILDFVIKQYEAEPSFADIEIKRSYDSRIPKTTLDANQLRHVMQNLLLNAMHAFEGRKGCIHVTTRSAPSADAYTIRVEDNGAGIEKDHLEQVFDPFFSRREGGTGLGLTVVRRIVEAHGGTIQVKSSKGKGTAVTMRFPVDARIEGMGSLK